MVVKSNNFFGFSYGWWYCSRRSVMLKIGRESR